MVPREDTRDKRENWTIPIWIYAETQRTACPSVMTTGLLETRDQQPWTTGSSGLRIRVSPFSGWLTDVSITAPTC